MLPVLESSELLAFRAELNGKFLQSVYVNKAAGSGIEASADTVVANARTRFLVERSVRQEGLLHVRCCYNNKYWVPVRVQDRGGSRWIIGTADKPEEDLSSPSCTLFQALPVKYKDKSIRFFHCGVRKSACVVSIIGTTTYLRKTDDAEDEETNSGTFTVVGLPRQKELPKYVAFKGDNGKYLSTQLKYGNRTRKFLKVVRGSTFTVGPIRMMGPFYLGSSKESLAIDAVDSLGQQFDTEDIGDPSVIFTTYTNDDGSVRIASNTGGGFWKLDSSKYICTENVEDKNNRDALFEVVTAGDGFVALRNLGNNKFCARTYFEGKLAWLAAVEDTVSQYARLTLVEPLLSQEIYDVRFNLDEARIYNNELITVDSDTFTNDTQEVQTGTFSFKKITEVVGTWETTVSSKTVNTEKLSASATKTPIVVGAEVTLSRESATSERGADSTRTSEERTVTQNFTVRGKETITAKFVATQASCDVPFSYKKQSLLTNGKVILTDHNDGIYTGVNTYDFRVTLTGSSLKSQDNKVRSQSYRFMPNTIVAISFICLLISCVFFFHVICRTSESF